MPNLVPPEELPKWVPGDVLCASDTLGWKQVALRSYRYLGQDVIVPAMRDFMLVGYQQGATPMRRRFDGPWSRATCAPGAVSLLTRAETSHWRWTETIDVTHVYLSPELVVDVASEMAQRPVREVTLADVLRADDPLICAAMQAIFGEAREQGLGGPLYVETVARALIMHLLRKYASVGFIHHAPHHELTQNEKRRIADYIDAQLDQALDLKGMAAAIDLDACQFARNFKRSFGLSPYAFVIERRLERAQRLLALTSEPIKAIAAACGFADQAHLTRLFLRSRGAPPAAFRKECRREPSTNRSEAFKTPGAPSA